MRVSDVTSNVRTESEEAAAAEPASTVQDGEGTQRSSSAGDVSPSQIDTRGPDRSPDTLATASSLPDSRGTDDSQDVGTVAASVAPAANVETQAFDAHATETVPAHEGVKPNLDHTMGLDAARAILEGSRKRNRSRGNRFEILKPHARGGLGEVFLAHDRELNREVALKEIQDRYSDRPESQARFVIEAEITGSLEHPGIVPVYSLSRDSDGLPFYAMRFIRGESLDRVIKKFHESGGLDHGEHFLEFRQLLNRFVDVCNTIAFAHSRQVLHRDLKPANVMLGPFGETLVVDWGLAKRQGGEEAPGAREDPSAHPDHGNPRAQPSRDRRWALPLT